MSQLTLEIARAQGQAGMERAVDHAERASPGISELMYLYLVRYAIRCQRTDRFTSEAITTLYAADAGLVQPPDMRAWGGVFTRAMNRGVLAIADYNGTRTLGHGVKGAKRYRSLVCGRKWSDFGWSER